MNSEHKALERYVDMTELLARVDNDSELLVAAHTLKGMLANLSIKHADQLAASVEIAARAGDAQEIQKAMAGFDREETGLLAAIESFISGRNP